jgi:NifU-like protein involved in Fe-S cluster formation
MNKTCLRIAIGLLTLPLAWIARAGDAEETIDLGSVAADSFAPYVFDRNPLWILLPIFTLAVILYHLKKTRRNKPMKPKAHIQLNGLAIALILWGQIESASAIQFEDRNSALRKLLGATQVKSMTATVDTSKTCTTRWCDARKDKAYKAQAFYAKQGGKVTKVAYIAQGLYPPNCTHTWAIGINPASGTVTDIRVMEMGCPHAHPTNTPSFMDQYKGKGLADVQKLDSDIQTIAKATGTCEILTDVVKKTIVAYSKMKGKM